MAEPINGHDILSVYLGCESELLYAEEEEVTTTLIIKLISALKAEVHEML